MSDAPTPPPKDKVPITIPARMRYWRLHYLPVIVWVVAAGVAVYIANNQRQQQVSLSGLVEIREAFVASTFHGIVAAIEVDLYQEVEAGAIIATMDDQLLLAELETAQAELARRRSELAAARHNLLWENDQLVRGQASDLRRLALDEEEARLDVLDREAALEVLRVQKEGLDARLARLNQLLEGGFTDQASQEVVFYELKSTEARIAEQLVALESARQLQENAGERRREAEELAGTLARDVDSWLAPFEQVLAVQESMLDGLARRRERLVLRAPLAGRVTALTASAGQTVLAGDPIVTITSNNAERIVAYVGEQMMESITVGTEVELQTRRMPRQVLRTRITAVSAKVEEMPARLWIHPMLPQWGLPVLIDELPAAGLYPGEVIDLRVLSTSDGS